MIAPSPTPGPRRWNLQFSLRTLMIFVTGAALFMAFIGRNWYLSIEQRTAVEIICNRPDGYVRYSGSRLFGKAQSVSFDRPWPPRFLVRLLGQDILASVDGAIIDSADLEQIKHLPRLQTADIGLSSLPLSSSHIKLLARLQHFDDLFINVARSDLFTDSDLRRICEAIQLRGLCISNAYELTLDGFAALENQKRLRSFVCLQRLPDTFVDVVAKWPRIEFLYVNLSDAGMTKLCALENAKELKCLSVLSSAHAAADKNSDESLMQISRLVNLREFTFVGNASNAGLTEIAKLPQLQMLFLQSKNGTTINDDGMKVLADRCRSLLDIRLNGIPITEVGLNHLAEIPGLKFIDVDSDNVTATGVEHVRAAHPNLAIHFCPPDANDSPAVTPADATSSDTPEEEEPGL